jgi:SSS family solute:Na+ symporter
MLPMSTLNMFVILYLMVTIGIGLYAARRVHSAKDYVVAGRSLPLYITTATVFATWFGSETVLGTSATFLEEGLLGIAADPFGASLCLILVGLFYARKLYRMNLLTIADFFRNKYGRTVEILISVAIMISYLGWVSAQMVALGLVFNTLSHGAIPEAWGIVIGAAIVIVYTTYGGMWSVALTDFMQMIVIVVGMLFIGYYVTGEVGGVTEVVNHAVAADKLNILPEATLAAWLAVLGPFITMALGSIPQQDVFQRVMSAKDEKTAVMGGVLGGSLYLVFAFIPIGLAYAALLIDPQMVQGLMADDSQKVLPTLITQHTPLIAQILFFGALLSAILSTASGTLLAPSTIFTENLLRPMLGQISDEKFLWVIRSVVAAFGLLVMAFALNSTSSIFEMVENAYKVTLVAAFIPLTLGLYWSRATTQGAMLSITLGVTTWVLLEISNPEGVWPPQIVGLGMAIVGMLVGSLTPQLLHRDRDVLEETPPV